jgi:cyclohexanone monooxygenase
VEATAEAEQAWLAEMRDKARLGLKFYAECTPGYYNNEGKETGPGREFFVGYPYGAMAYFAYIDQWRNTGEFDGLEFR